MIDSVCFLRGMQETYTERRAIGVAAGLACAADELETLRRRVSIYEGVMQAAKMDVEALRAIGDDPGGGR